MSIKITNYPTLSLIIIIIKQGTTGEDMNKVSNIFSHGTNYAVIAPNMAKQIVAMQATLQEMSKRFPNSFLDYKLTV